MGIEQLLINITLILAAITATKYTMYLITGAFYHYKSRKYLKMARTVTKADIEKFLKISIIIPAWNESVGILETVKSLLKSTYDNLEIVVVNDGSTDNTDSIVRNFISNEFSQLNISKSLKYIKKANGGKGSALNEGIRNSSGNLIVTMDADTIFEDDALLNAAMYFYKTDIDAAVGNVKIANSKSLLGILQQIEYTIGFHFKRAFAVLNCEYIIGGAFGIFKRDVFERFGYFDEKIKTEDIELSIRLQSKGCKLFYLEDAIAYTEGPVTIKDLMKQRLRWKKGRLDTFLKHKGLFLSSKKEHNKVLTFYLLPITLFYEIELLFEPLFTLFGIYYVITTQDYNPILIWIIFTGIVYTFTFLFGSRKNSKIAFAFIPTYFFMSYLLNFTEVCAMYTSVKLLFSGQDIVWQKWQRKGLSNV